MWAREGKQQADTSDEKPLGYHQGWACHPSFYQGSQENKK